MTAPEHELTGRRCPECGWVTAWVSEWGDDDNGEPYFEPHAGEDCGLCGWESP